MKTLMILGALEEFVPLVALAKKKGIRTVVVDGNPGAPAKALADRAYDADIRDTAACAALADLEGVDAITTAYSDLLLECMVKIASRANLPCHLKEDQLPYYRDKAVIDQTCQKLGIKRPRSVRLTRDFRDRDLEGLTYPLVIKPLDLYGSRGLFIVHNQEEIRQRFTACRGTSQKDQILAEEYNPDHEFNIQCWVRHGQVQVLGLADREKTSFDPATVPLSTRNVYPSRLIHFVYDQALQVLATYISCTGQTEGPLAMQFYWGPERGLVVGEIAARFLGYEHELIRYANSLSIEDLLLSGAVDDRNVDSLLAQCQPFGSRSAAVLYLHGRDGIVHDQKAVLAAARRKDVQYAQLFYQTGDRVGSPQSMPYFARFDLVADTREEIDRRSEDILNSLTALGPDGHDLLLKGKLPDYHI